MRLTFEKFASVACVGIDVVVASAVAVVELVVEKENIFYLLQFSISVAIVVVGFLFCFIFVVVSNKKGNSKNLRENNLNQNNDDFLLLRPYLVLCFIVVACIALVIVVVFYNKCLYCCCNSFSFNLKIIVITTIVASGDERET